MAFWAAIVSCTPCSTGHHQLPGPVHCPPSLLKMAVMTSLNLARNGEGKHLSTFTN